MVVVCVDIRSAHNIGSILRTCDGFGVTEVYCTGLTPHTALCDQPPHVRIRWNREISKTALGAEKNVRMIYHEDPSTLIVKLNNQGFLTIALEQSESSNPITAFSDKTDKIAVFLGTETVGLPDVVLKKCDRTIEIPMVGLKESFNVAVACGICLYHLKYLKA